MSSAESVFQRRVGRKWDLFRHCQCRSAVSCSFRRALTDWDTTGGDRYRRCMELRVRMRRPTWTCCKAVTNIERATYAREKTKERKYERGDLRVSMHGHSWRLIPSAAAGLTLQDTQVRETLVQTYYRRSFVLTLSYVSYVLCRRTPLPVMFGWEQ